MSKQERILKSLEYIQFVVEKEIENIKYGGKCKLLIDCIAYDDLVEEYNQLFEDVDNKLDPDYVIDKYIREMAANIDYCSYDGFTSFALEINRKEL